MTDYEVLYQQSQKELEEERRKTGIVDYYQRLIRQSQFNYLKVDNINTPAGLKAGPCFLILKITPGTLHTSIIVNEREAEFITRRFFWHEEERIIKSKTGGKITDKIKAQCESITVSNFDLDSDTLNESWIYSLYQKNDAYTMNLGRSAGALIQMNGHEALFVAKRLGMLADAYLLNMSTPATPMPVDGTDIKATVAS